MAQWPDVACPRPEGAFYLFVDVRRHLGAGGAVELCARLLEDAHVALVPGDGFGDPHCVRLSYAVADDQLRDALERVGQALRS